MLMTIIKVLLNKDGMVFFLAQAMKRNRLLLLFLFWVVAVVITLFMPRLFAGEVSIIPVRFTGFTLGDPLTPTSQNFSQLAYLSISIAYVFATFRLLRNAEYYGYLIKAILLGAVLVVVTGALDYLDYFVDIDPLLAPFRTASYALLVEVEIMGGKRVVGLMPEASAYGSLCVFFLCLVHFFRDAIPQTWVRERLAPALVLLLILFIWMSTSSAAYVGLAAFLLVAVSEWSGRRSTLYLSMHKNRRFGFEFWTAWLLLSMLGMIVLFSPDSLDPVVDKMDQLVFNKTETSSYEERSMWTAVGWQALRDTWGLGVGMGATRTSSFIAAVFSNVGILGGVLYFGFVAQILLRKKTLSTDKKYSILLRGVRYAYIPSFIVAILVGTTADFGSYNAILYGLALALVSIPDKKENAVRENIYHQI
ncbi:hypothetical protein [Oceanisphaera avium]|nr:hypothetical protein [Oceanisphaera avium]